MFRIVKAVTHSSWRKVIYTANTTANVNARELFKRRKKKKSHHARTAVMKRMNERKKNSHVLRFCLPAKPKRIKIEEVKKCTQQKKKKFSYWPW